jgi:two-component system chemotaxis sensor kinase CheA
MATKDEAFHTKLLATFRIEAKEHIDAVSSGLVQLEKAPPTPKQGEIVETVFREVHSLKGAARVVNFSDVEAVCRPLEDLLAQAKEEKIPLSRELFDLLHDAVALLAQLLEAGEPSAAASSSVMASLIQRLAAAGERPPTAPAARRRMAARTMSPTDDGAGAAGPPAPDPGKGAIAARSAARETIRIGIDKLDALYRQAEEMISAKLAAEQRLKDLREAGIALDRSRPAWAAVRAALQELRRGGTVAPAAVSRLSEALETELAAMHSLAGRFRTLTDAAAADQRELRKMIDNLIGDARSLLMLPLSSLFEMLPGLIRNLSRDSGKEVDLVIQGAELEIDRRIQEELKDPLIHIVRNCVDHGIETPELRKGKGKPASGTITIAVSRLDPGKAQISISDDGAGIDREGVATAARKLGLVSDEEAAKLDAEAAAALAFASGVSTSKFVTDISGRGLGLAIVREKVEKLGGSIWLETHGDAGTTFRIVLPLTLAALRAIVVRAGDRLFGLPTTSVERVTRRKRDAIRSVENRESIPLNGQMLSLVYLSDLLGLERAERASGDYEKIVVLSARGERIAFVVDEVLDELEMLVKGLDGSLSQFSSIAGVATLGTGALVQVLNVAQLMSAGIEATQSPASALAGAAGEAPAKSILVVEDSITTRTLLKNILEAVGYRVKTAVDGVDAITTLKSEKFDLVVSDVEMPRMDGCELTLRIRKDKKLADLPVVLVTALESREHRERGIDAGANAYIVKSSFEHDNLLEVIRRSI